MPEIPSRDKHPKQQIIEDVSDSQRNEFREIILEKIGNVGLPLDYEKIDAPLFWPPNNNLIDMYPLILVGACVYRADTDGILRWRSVILSGRFSDAHKGVVGPTWMREWDRADYICRLPKAKVVANIHIVNAVEVPEEASIRNVKIPKVLGLSPNSEPSVVTIDDILADIEGKNLPQGPQIYIPRNYILQMRLLSPDKQLIIQEG